MISNRWCLVSAVFRRSSRGGDWVLVALHLLVALSVRNLEF